MFMQDGTQRHAIEFFTGNCAPKAEAHFVNIAVILPGGITRPQMLAGVIETPTAGALPKAPPAETYILNNRLPYLFPRLLYADNRNVSFLDFRLLCALFKELA
jgi:hypothetical protein